MEELNTAKQTSRETNKANKQITAETEGLCYPTKVSSAAIYRTKRKRQKRKKKKTAAVL